VRVIVITGAGRAFCSGADVGHLAHQTSRSIDAQLAPLPKFTARQNRVYKPTICAINGVCAGAGLHFVADSDIVIASSAASFVDTHVNVGQVTALEPIGLLRRMAMGDVLRMVILGKAERLNAAQAKDARMISEVLDPADLMPRAMELAGIAAAVSPAAVKTSLKAIWQSLDMTLSQSYEVGYDMLIRYRTHPDASEGPRAFLEKREPKWE
jgi:enoyl-CoA hydratase/carnithine racemase